MAPPAKRQKRNIIRSDSSDNEAATTQTSSAGSRVQTQSQPTNVSISTNNSQASQTDPKPALRQRKQPRAKTANHPHNAAPIRLPQHPRSSRDGSKSTSVSPQKTRSKGTVDGKVQGGNIQTLFSRQASRQRAVGARAIPAATADSTAATGTSRARSPEATLAHTDSISDDGSDHFDVHATSLVGLADRKRSRGQEQGSASQPSSTRTASQRPFSQIRTPALAKPIEDTRPWAERFGPANVDELAVHKKKVDDVRRWLHDVYEGGTRQRLLLLKGGAGTGKTSTLSVLAKSMDCEILEWRNPVGSSAGAEGNLSIPAQFADFMDRGGAFGQLTLRTDEQDSDHKHDNKPLDRRKQLLLVEDFPSTVSRTSSALQAFRNTILTYLATSTPPLSLTSQNHVSHEDIRPAILILSESLLATSSAATDSLTAHRLLGPEILQHPGTRVIEFNAVAPTILVKGLELVIQKEARVSGRRTTPGDQILKMLGEMGDIRNAIGSLEFLCLRGDADGDWGSKVAFGKVKKRKETKAMSQTERMSLELVTRREAALGIFHAVGKVVYNKRNDRRAPASVAIAERERLAEHLVSCSRPKASQVDVDALLDETGTDTPTFIAALHENFVLSCEPPPASEYSTLDHVNACLDYICDSDVLCPSFERSGSTAAIDVLRQSEVSFEVAVRGLLYSLPSPVKRLPNAKGSLQGGRGDPYKMFYPQSMRIWRAQEEMESLLETCLVRLLRNRSESEETRRRPGFLAQSRLKSSDAERSSTNAQDDGEDDDEKPHGSPIAFMTKTELLLERLPYVAHVARYSTGTSRTATAVHRGATPISTRDLELITTFHGIAGAADDDSDTGPHPDVEAGGNVGDDVPRATLVIRGNRNQYGMKTTSDEQKLVLSDDDIEDD